MRNAENPSLSPMKTNHQHILYRNQLAGLLVVLETTFIAAGLCVSPTFAQNPSDIRSDGKVIIESGEATLVTEKVRASAPGTLVAIMVKVGDTVKKGRILGHTELTAAKYQLDLAKYALENTATLKAAEGQADAWQATRIETEQAARKRIVEKSRIDWAIGMEKFYRGNFEAQIENKKIQRVHYKYWQEQYEARFLRAPVDGVVSSILLEPGDKIDYATHVFTISNEHCYLVPISVPAKLIQRILANSILSIRSTQSLEVTRGKVDSIIDDPASPDKKIVRLLVRKVDMPPGANPTASGATFDVLLPQERTPSPHSPDATNGSLRSPSRAVKS